MSSSRRPRRATAGRKETGKSCPFCRFPVKERDEITFCGYCDSPHHSDCWDDNHGCAVARCPGGPHGESDATGARPSRSGSNLPPKAGPSAKKQRIEIDPEPRKPKKRPAPKKAPAASAGATQGPTGPESTSHSTYWIAGGIAVVVALICIVLISNNFGDDRGAVNEVSCEAGTGEGGVPCIDNGVLPNIPQSEMKFQIGEFIRGWYGEVNGLNWGTAFSKLSNRRQQQILRSPGGRSQWERNLRGMSKWLKPDQAKVTIEEPSYDDEGVVSVYVSNMPYKDPNDLCGSREGVTWVRWNAANEEWTYEPGYDVTPQRADDWGYQESQLLKNTCK